MDVSAQDSSPQDAAPDASAPDAWVRPDARAFDFCDQPIFKMPFDGTEGYLVEQEIEGTSIYYAYRAFGNPGFIYRFDLERCEELQLTLDGEAGAFGVGNGVLVYQRLGEEPLCCDLDVLHTSDLSIEPLKRGPACEWKPRTNGRHVAYFSQPDNQSQGEFRLLDMSLGTDIRLPYRGIRTPTNLSDRYLVFSAYPLLPGTEGTDVFVHDLHTGDTTSIEASHELCQDWVFVWEDYLAWSGSTGCTSAPYHMMVHNLETGESIMLLEEDYSVSITPIRGGLVAYNTSRYSGIDGRSPTDVELYDVETRITRRITSESGRFWAARIDPPYLLLALSHGPALRYDLYVANLEMLGVLTPEGRLIPGEGVLVSP